MIYNGQPIPPADEAHKATTGQIIWVNNLKRRKRPQLFVELARRLPEYRFVIVGAMPSGGSYAQKLKRMIQDCPDNLEYLGALPLDEVNELIRQSDLLLYTSKAGSEGFGNSFLQAWHRAVPTISLSCGMDGILEREGIGCFCESFDQLVENVQELMQDEETRLAMGRRAREYGVRQHSTARMVSDFEALFEGVLDGSAATQPVATVS
jgi:glycosyltransferase involved in cell wall biosynthesis